MFSWIGTLGSGIWKYACAAGAVVIAILYALLQIKSAEEEAEEAKRKAAEQARDRVVDINNENEAVRQEEKAADVAADKANKDIKDVVDGDSQDVSARVVKDESVIDNGWGDEEK